MVGVKLVPTEYKRGRGGAGGRVGGEGRRGEREVGGPGRGVPLVGGPREAEVCCVWEGGGNVIVVCVCTAEAEPRLGW